MATKPTNTAVWATDTTNTTVGAVENGQTVKLEPSTGVKQQGWIAGEEAPARWMNWWKNTVHTWVLYLDDLHNSTEFLNKAYAWVGAHSFASPTVFTNTTTMSNDGVFSAAKTRTKYATLVGQGDNSGNTWVLSSHAGNGPQLITTLDTQPFAWIHLPMPEGATLQSVRVTYRQGATGRTTAASAGVYLLTTSDANDNSASLQGSADSHSNAALYDDILPTFTAFTPSSAQFAAVQVIASQGTVSGGSYDTIIKVKYTYTETRATGT